MVDVYNILKSMSYVVNIVDSSVFIATVIIHQASPPSSGCVFSRSIHTLSQAEKNAELENTAIIHRIMMYAYTSPFIASILISGITAFIRSDAGKGCSTCITVKFKPA